MLDKAKALGFRTSKILFIVNAVFNMAFLFIMAYAFSRPLRSFVESITRSSIIVITIYSFFFYLFYFFFTFPLKFYEGFILKRQDNKQFRNWLEELIKKETGIFIPFLITIQIIYFFLETNIRLWWLPMAILFIVILNACELLPDYYIALFSKCRPLQDKNLKNQLVELGERADLDIKDVFICTRNKPKVTMLGVSKNRKLILNDVILNFSKEEIQVLASEEMVKLKSGSIWKQPLMDSGAIIITFISVALLLPFGVERFGFEFIFDVETLPVLLLLFSSVYFLVYLGLNYFKQDLARTNDIFTLELSQSPEAFISLMIRNAEQDSRKRHAIHFLEDILDSESYNAQRMILAQDYAQKLRYEKVNQGS